MKKIVESIFILLDAKPSNLCPLFLFALSVCLAGICNEAASKSLSGASVRVIDGDGLKLGGQSVRLWGIDAPELRQECSADGRRYPCGEKARDALTAFLGAAVPTCETVNQDRYGRRVVKCEVAGDDLAGLMVRSGWAVDYPRYSKGAYAADQNEAEAHKRGLWAGFFVAPWDWRKEN